MQKRISAFFTGFMSDQVLDYFFWAKVIPFISAILAGGVALLESMGLAWSLVIMAFMFYLVSGSLYFFDEWRDKNKVKGMLQFNGFNLGKDMVDPTAGSIIPKFLNRASFPMAIEVKKLRVSFNQKIPEKEALNSSKLVIPPLQEAGVSSQRVYTVGEFKDQGVNGEIEATIKYGKGKKLKHTLEVRKKIVARFDQNGSYVDGVIIDKEDED